jgi:hypothetical protein
MRSGALVTAVQAKQQYQVKEGLGCMPSNGLACACRRPRWMRA